MFKKRFWSRKYALFFEGIYEAFSFSGFLRLPSNRFDFLPENNKQRYKLKVDSGKEGGLISEDISIWSHPQTNV